MTSLLHQLAFGIWAFRPEAAPAYMAQVREFMVAGRHLQVPDTPAQELMIRADLHFVAPDGTRMAAHQPATVEPQPGMVAVLDIHGPILKHDGCGTPGTNTMARWLAEFEATPEVDGVVLNIDSPGGSGYGMLALTSQLERMRKPVVAVVQHGMATSAAYGIAAACDRILSNSPVNEFGSIGTYVRITNWDKFNAQEGLEVHTIRASRSMAKNRDVEEALLADPNDPNDPHYNALRRNYIDPFNEHFIELVQRNRPLVKDEHEVLAGRVLMADEALRLGLIDDAAGSMEAAIATVRDLAKQSITNTP